MQAQLGNPQGRVQYEHRQHDENINKLDGVRIHDGIPKIFFNQTWRVEFEQALGQKTQDGFPMTVVLYGNDMGGVNWVGPAPNADQQRQHTNREIRLYNINSSGNGYIS